jgi:hypothetical protein
MDRTIQKFFSVNRKPNARPI